MKEAGSSFSPYQENLPIYSSKVSLTCLLCAWIDDTKSAESGHVLVELEFFKDSTKAEERAVYRYQELSKRFSSIQVQCKTIETNFSLEIDANEAYEDLLNRHHIVITLDPFVLRKRKELFVHHDSSSEPLLFTPFLSFDFELDGQIVDTKNEETEETLETYSITEAAIQLTQSNYKILSRQGDPYTFILSYANPFLDFDEFSSADQLTYHLKKSSIELTNITDSFPRRNFKRTAKHLIH